MSVSIGMDTCMFSCVTMLLSYWRIKYYCYYYYCYHYSLLYLSWDVLHSPTHAHSFNRSLSSITLYNTTVVGYIYWHYYWTLIYEHRLFVATSCHRLTTFCFLFLTNAIQVRRMKRIVTKTSLYGDEQARLLPYAAVTSSQSNCFGRQRRLH